MANVFKVTPKLWTPQREVAIATNLHNSYMRAPEHLRNFGAQFYPMWHKTAQHIGEQLGMTTEHGAAILAHLSPQNEAELNRFQGLGLVHAISDEGHKAILEAGMHVRSARSITSKMHPALKSGKIGKDSREHLEMLEQIAHHESENERLRKQSGIIGTPLAWRPSDQLANASSLIVGKRINNPLSTLGAVKIRDFGGAIADPGSGRVAIDTHYHDAALNRIDIPYDAKRGLSAKGRYEHFQHASSRAHHRTLAALGLSPEDLPHNAFMGGIWYAHQQRKVLGNPSARSARQAADTKLAKVTNNPRLRAFRPEEYGLEPTFGKIEY